MRNRKYRNTKSDPGKQKRGKKKQRKEKKNREQKPGNKRQEQQQVYVRKVIRNRTHKELCAEVGIGL